MQHQERVHHQIPVLEHSELKIDHLHQAIECLSLLCKGNQMTEKCVRYTSSLARMLSAICKWSLSRIFEQRVDMVFTGCSESAQEPNLALDLSAESLGTFSLPLCSDGPHAHGLHDFQESSDLHMGMTLDDFFGEDFTYVTSLKNLES